MATQPCKHHLGAKASVVVSLAVSAVFVSRAGAVNYPGGFEVTDRDAADHIVVKLSNFITAPKTNNANTSAQTAAQVARINFIRQEPVASLASQRLFMNDLNGNVYIYNRGTQAFTTYLHFDTTLFPRFDTDPGFAAGVVTVQFDPDYANNGKFYTVHTELPAAGGNGAFRDAVVEEWQDTNINNTTFEGTRSELLRVSGYSGNIHPVGDITFNPTATPGSPDWRNMYIASGDGSAGESTSTSTRAQDQMLNNFLGKVLRITPAASGTPGTYTVPAGNPFAGGGSFTGAKTEVYAYGFRNPHRLSWDVDPADANHTPRLYVDDIGLHSYEELNLVKPGANYGYSTLEGPQVLDGVSSHSTFNQVLNNTALPGTLPIYVTTTASSPGNITPTYPLTAFSHRDGDAITSGFVYRGNKLPALYGKYVFGDITTGRLFWADLAQLLAADDGDPTTEAPIHELKVLFDSPYDILGLRPKRVFDIVHDEFDRRSETAVGTQLHDGAVDGDNLPGTADATSTIAPNPYPTASGPFPQTDGNYTGGRADIRWALIDNELYLISKADGMIRALSAPLYGDADDNGVVNALDFNALATHFGQSAQPWKNGDFNGDGIVNALDFGALASNFGQAPPPDAALGGLVPEPCLALLALPFLLLFRRSRKD